jgi:hypothetical protein
VGPACERHGRRGNHVRERCVEGGHDEMPRPGLLGVGAVGRGRVSKGRTRQ